jgi:pimeloyl-ACP methyl ester carboxylesterase
MNYHEFGSKDRETIILLHGGGLSWWNYRKEAEMLQSDHHVILPVLDGHAESDRPFTSIEDNASEIVEFIDERCSGKVLMIGGLSLGAQIALEILSRRRDICRCAMIESASVIPSGLTGALIGPAFGSGYGLIKNRRFARLQFKSLRMDEAFFEDYYRDTCRIAKPDMIAFLKASVSYSLNESLSETSAQVRAVAGAKEKRGILKSLDAIKQLVPGCRVDRFPGLYHGEFSINHPERCVEFIKETTGTV